MDEMQKNAVRDFMKWLRGVKGFEVAQWLKSGDGRDQLGRLKERDVEALLAEYESREKPASAP